VYHLLFVIDICRFSGAAFILLFLPLITAAARRAGNGDGSRIWISSVRGNKNGQ